MTFRPSAVLLVAAVLPAALLASSEAGRKMEAGMEPVVNAMTVQD